MNAIDSTGLKALETFVDAVHDSGSEIILCNSREQPRRRMRKAEFEGYVGAVNICGSIAEALERAKTLSELGVAVKFPAEL